jgi:DNA-binding CsgD family transcriptional regulator
MAKRTIGAPATLIILMAVQLICAVFFMSDVVHDYMTRGTFVGIDLHLWVEIVATGTLMGALVLEGRFLADLLHRKARLEDGLAAASSEVHKVISEQFGDWRLSPAETDIAMFLVKGLGTRDIAELRGSAEGTIKAHFNSIFRKAGVHSRAELLSLLIDRLLGDRLAEPTEPAAQKRAVGD